MPLTALHPTPDDLAAFAAYEARGRQIHPDIKSRMVIERAVIRYAATFTGHLHHGCSGSLHA